MRPTINFLPRNKDLPPDGIVSIKIDKKTGLKLEGNSANSTFEYYLEEYFPE
jgi:membrane carboxypeptidase/penicillin-binding protein